MAGAVPLSRAPKFLIGFLLLFTFALGLWAVFVGVFEYDRDNATNSGNAWFPITVSVGGLLFVTGLLINPFKLFTSRKSANDGSGSSKSLKVFGIKLMVLGTLEVVTALGFLRFNDNDTFDSKKVTNNLQTELALDFWARVSLVQFVVSIASGFVFGDLFDS